MMLKKTDLSHIEWEHHYASKERNTPKYDNWLAKYNDLLQNVISLPVLDLGCGLGSDTLHLTELGYNVLSADFSKEALKKIKRSISNTRLLQFDFHNGLPFRKKSAGLIIADLSIHYFPWKMTLEIIGDFAEILVPSGYLLCRVNSVQDFNHGAGEGVMVERNYYERDGIYKRFFDRDDICKLFNNWNIIFCSECETLRYSKPKILWEIAIQKF